MDERTFTYTTTYTAETIYLECGSVVCWRRISARRSGLTRTYSEASSMMRFGDAFQQRQQPPATSTTSIIRRRRSLLLLSTQLKDRRSQATLATDRTSWPAISLIVRLYGTYSSAWNETFWFTLLYSWRRHTYLLRCFLFAAEACAVVWFWCLEWYDKRVQGMRRRGRWNVFDTSRSSRLIA